MLYASALSLLQNFDPLQIKYAPTEWRSLLEYIASAAEDAKKVWFSSLTCILRAVKLMNENTAVSRDSTH